VAQERKAHDPATASCPASSAQLPKEKQTELGLYIPAKDACEKWKANPEKLMVLDFRTLEEFLFVGHPPMAWKIPIATQSYE
jgi:hypothetical protein